MACKITYDNKKYTQPEFNEYFKSHFFEFAGDFIGSKQDIERFKQFVQGKPKSVKPGVEELFEANPELANSVYEALGYDILNIDLKINRVGNRMNVVTSSSNNKAQIDITVEDKNAYITNTFVEKVQQGFGTLSYIKLANELIKQGLILTSDLNGLDLQESGKVLWESLVSKNLAFYNSNIGRYVFSGQQAQQLYSQYLDTIFPDSKVKDIVYRGGEGGISKEQYYTLQKQYAERYGKAIPTILNLPNPIIADRGIHRNWVKDELDNRGLIGKDYPGSTSDAIIEQMNGDIPFSAKGDFDVYVIKNENQKHTLGSKQDIEGFKKFVSKETKKVDKDLNQKLQNILQKLYPEIKLNITNNPIWEQGDNIFNQEEYNNQVNYRLKATEKVLDNLSKIKQWESNKSIDQNTLWGKIGELGISKQQLELLRESEGNTIEEKLTSFIANYSYTVEINTAKEKTLGDNNATYTTNGVQYVKFRENDYRKRTLNSNFEKITKEEFEKNQNAPTQYYSNLTVPGGTNYTENEISTPLITPNIKGHAQFSTDKGIGWFRSDEQGVGKKLNKQEDLDFPMFAGFNNEYSYEKGSKTRRILEIQSDLFQKGRDKEDLISKKGKYYRVLNINLGKDVTFEPKTYSEAFEQGEDGKWYPKYNKYGGYWRSNIPEISASKNIGSAVMGNWTASGMPQTTEFFIYELEDGVEPDYDISHLEIGDFKQLQEVRYRKPVKGKLIGEFKLTPDIYKIFNENYDLMSEDGGINKHYELEDEFEKKYGYRPYDEKAPEGVVEIFNKIQDDYWKEQSLKVEKALQSIHNKYDEQVKQNQFLQLLNKDNNWVTFFVKSIIQDSAKKGYEKVLFPSGNTASKVEGHTTLEEFKKQKEDRIKELEKREITHTLDYAKKFNNPDGKLWSIANSTFTFKTKEEAESFTKTKEYNLEIEQLKQELERVEKEGMGALKPIYNFYENTVTNILKKQGYKPEVITDEYGNTWNEVTLNQVRDLANILLQRNEANQIIGQANIKALSVLIDAVNQKQDTLPHEYAHHYIAWYRNTPIVQEAIKKWGSEEALVQSIGEQAVIQKGEAWSWWKRFTTWLLNKLNKLSSLDKQELTQILTDAFLTRQNLNQTTQSEKQTSDIWSQNKESIQSKFPDLTEDQFNQMTEQEKTKFIKCYL